MRRLSIIDACLLGCLAVLFLATGPVALLMAGPARAGQPALVVAPPWGLGADGIIAAAGGRAIGPVAAPLARLAVLDSPGRARAAGAWAVLDAGALASLCGFEGT